MQRARALVVVVLVVALAVGTTGGASGALGGDVGSGTESGGTASQAERALVTLTINLQTNEGDPVQGAQVNVTYDGGSNTTRSFANGKALVNVPEGADVTITVSHSEYIKNHPATVSDVGANEEATLTMFPKATALVEVNSSDGGLLENAQVVLTKQGESDPAARGRTNADGLFQSDSIEAGTYTVAAFKRGYAQSVATYNFSAGTTSHRIDVEQLRVPVTVTVRDDHFQTPQPVEDATVYIYHDGDQLGTSQTDETGQTEILMGANGQYTFRVTKNGYEIQRQDFYLAESQKEFQYVINRNESLSVSAVNQRIVVGETVLVRVRNAYGEPVEGAQVLRNGTAVGTTDQNGETSVEIPSRGTFELSASTDGGSVIAESILVQGIEPAPDTTTTTETTTEEESSPLPGFGPMVAGLALALLAGLAALRRRR